MEAQEITREQAVALGESRFWEGMAPEEIALFQLSVDKLCMPFGVYQEAMEKALGRPVYTCEFGSVGSERLLAELFKERPPATFAEILDLIPAEKRVVLFQREEG